MCPPAASYSAAWGWTGSSAKAFKGEQNVHQLPLHCFVSLSLEAMFLNFCLDLYWPEQAVSEAFSAVRGYSTPCFVSLEFFAEQFEYSVWLDAWLLSLLPLLSQVLSSLPRGSQIPRSKCFRGFVVMPGRVSQPGVGQSLPNTERSASESSGQEYARCRRPSKVRSVTTLGLLFQTWMWDPAR